jgi:hypothetical protein
LKYFCLDIIKDSKARLLFLSMKRGSPRYLAFWGDGIEIEDGLDRRGKLYDIQKEWSDIV